MVKGRSQKIFITVFLAILFSIPVGFFLASKRMEANSLTTRSYDTTITNPPPVTNQRALALEDSSKSLSLGTSAQSNQQPTGFGPNLSFKVILEGRPVNQQQTKMFVGIAPGPPSNNPQYLLTFTVDLPASGEYKGVSLAGLSTGATYTAYLKGPAQIATSSAFLMNPTGVILNGGQPLTLLTGDVNEDNVIDQADYDIERKALATTSSSPDWNPNLDFNLDGVINNLDLEYIIKNLGKVGSSGKWYSTNPQVATNSASLSGPPSIGGEASPKGYWMWVPSY